MITFKYSAVQPAEMRTTPSIDGEYTEWVDVRDMTIREIKEMLADRFGPAYEDPEVALEAKDAGFLGIHHSGWGYIAKAMAEEK